MSDPNDVRDVAEQLDQLDPGELRRVLESHGFTGRSKAENFYDVAEVLLAPEHTERWIRDLDRWTLDSLAHWPDGEHLRPESFRSPIDDLVGVVVVGSDGLRLASGVAASLLTRETRQALSTPRPVPRDSTASSDAEAIERAVANLTRLDDLLTHIERRPPRLTATGRVTSAELKHIAAELDVSPATIEQLVRLASHGHLTRGSDQLTLSTAGSTWLRATLRDRWLVLATAVVDLMPGTLAEVLAESGHGIHLTELIQWVLPLRSVDESRTDALCEELGTLIGCVNDGLVTGIGALLLEDAESAADRVAAAAPPTVDQVYVQHDLSVIAPGTLRADLDAQLREFSVLESRAEASTYRFTPESIERGLSTGLSAPDMLGFVARISITGVPQSLEYLVTDQSTRYGRISVTLADDGASAIISTADPGTAHQLSVDSELRLLELRLSSETTLTSPYPPAFVHSSLRDARYASRGPSVDGPGPSSEVNSSDQTHNRARVMHNDDLALLISRVREGTPSGAGERDRFWKHRLLSNAAKEKRAVSVRLRRSDGAEHATVLEPTGVTMERLRARDRESDTERTIPLSAIVSVE